MLLDTDVLFQVSYGLYILTAERAGSLNGCLINALCQVNSEPPTFQVIVNKLNLTHDYVLHSGAFGVSILEQGVPIEFLRRFGFRSGRQIEKIDASTTVVMSDGIPVVKDYALGYLACKVFKTLDVDTHTIFIGKLIGAEKFPLEGIPLTYSYYREVKKGKTAKNAPTYISPEKQSQPIQEATMAKYVCDVCGYIYDPAAGDPDAGIAVGTAFEALPDSWVCPVCGVGKSEFSKL